MEVTHLAGRTCFAMTGCEVDFNQVTHMLTLLPTYYAFGCEYSNRGFTLGREDAFKLIAAIEKAMSITPDPQSKPSPSG